METKNMIGTGAKLSKDPVKNIAVKWNQGTKKVEIVHRNLSDPALQKARPESNYFLSKSIQVQIYPKYFHSQEPHKHSPRPKYFEHTLPPAF